jgi:hypothetical protein
MSALPSEADIRAGLPHVCFVPEAVITTSRQRECRFRAADNFSLDAFAQIAPDYGISLIQINRNGYTSIKVVNALQETGQQCIQEWQRP